MWITVRIAALRPLAPLYGLRPIAAYVGIPVAALTVVFRIVLRAGRKRWKR